MAKLTFVNLPVKDLGKSMEFFKGLGFTFNSQFTDDKAACMVINENATFSMLITEPFYKTFLRGGEEVADPRKNRETLIALALENKQAVDEMADKALALGGTDYRKEELDFMYTRAIQDLDGHVWELFYMDMSKMPQNA